MKIRALALLLSAVALPCFAEPTKEQLVGHWRYIGDNQNVDYTFKADGTFSGKITEEGNVVLAITGNWSLDGNKLTYEIRTSTPEVITPGTIDRDKITELTRDYYIIETAFYARRQYSRVD
ncbi:MAG TPA: lipocalin family protein [Chthoniobacterales bacterium]|nr:lipocalin family protein [Chthoniobacterales bacterium]